MTFIRVKYSQQIPSISATLSSSTLINEQEIEVRTITTATPKIIFHGEGLNPCMVIMVYGSYGDNDDTVLHKPFVAVTHAIGVSSTANDKEIKSYCEEVIANIFCKIEDDLKASDICISASYLLRCQQAKVENKQEAAAAYFNKVLAKPKSINKIIEDDSTISLDIDYAEDYSFLCCEKKEVVKSDGESDSIHFFVRATIATAPQIIYYKGFQTFDNWLANKEKEIQHAESRYTLMPASSTNNKRPQTNIEGPLPAGLPPLHPRKK